VPNEFEAETPAQKKVRRYSAIEFLVALVLFIMAIPILHGFRHRVVIETVLFTVVMLSALLAVGASRRTMVPAAILSIPAVAGKWISFYWPHLMPVEIFLATAGMLFVAFVVGHLLRFVLRAPRVNIEVLCAAISNYLMLGLLWMFAYVLMARLLPEAFAFSAGTASGQIMDGPTALYFSFVTLCTVGYGDIVPVSPVARMLAFAEAITGLFYTAIIISRLVALYSSESREREADGT
jgi:hypothetical protein